MIVNNHNLKELPKGWISAYLKDTADINKKPSTEKFKDNTKVTFLPMRCVEPLTGKVDLSLTKPLANVKKGYTSFVDGDLLFAKITPCMENGKIAIAKNLTNGIGFGSTEFHTIRFHKGIACKLYFYLLMQESFRKNAKRDMTGTAGQLRVPKKYLEQSIIPLPPLAEQKRIVAKIEELFTKLDAGVQALKKVQAELKRYRQAVLKHAFEGKLTAEWRKKHKAELEPASKLLERIAKEREKFAKGKTKKLPPLNISELPELPTGWEWARIKEICDLINGRAFKPIEWSSNGLPIIRIQNLNNPDVSFNYCDFEVENNYIVDDGQLLFAWSGTPGTSFGAHIWKRGKAVLNQHIFKVEIDISYINKTFLMYLMNHNVTEYIRKAHGTAGLAHITKGKFEESPICIPPFVEQQKIVAEIERHFSIADQIEQTIEQGLKQSERLRQSILKRAFEGKLVLQDANDEPAEVLLERIRQQREQQQRKVKAKPKVTKITKRKHSPRIYFRRGAIISYTVDKLCDNNTFGRTQLMKIVHLTQCHIGIDLEFEFTRQAAGPFDKEIINVESLARKKGWFKTFKRRDGYGYYYRRGENMSKRCAAAVTILGEQKNGMDRLISVFDKMDTDQAEIFDTVYAVWNDMLIEGIEPTEDKIKEYFYTWSKEKKRFTPEQIHNCIEWMKDNYFVPTGKGLKTQAI